MRIDLLPELPPSGGYENIITAKTLFPRYACEDPVSSSTVENTVEYIIDIMTRHAYLPKLKILDRSSNCTSQIITEVSIILGITLKHATTKQAQTIGILERTHATIQASLKTASEEYRNQWHN